MKSSSVHLHFGLWPASRPRRKWFMRHRGIFFYGQGQTAWPPDHDKDIFEFSVRLGGRWIAVLGFERRTYSPVAEMRCSGLRVDSESASRETS